jgi:DNA-binding response OmpR family regulator
MEIQGKKVLIVEDDRATSDAASLILKGKGFDVVQAVDGVDAMAKVDQADIVLLDLFLPRMSGEEFLTKIRKVGNYVPVVVMSAGYDREHGKEHLKDYGIVDFIPKPFSAKDIHDKMSAAARLADDMRSVRKSSDHLQGFLSRQARA